MEYLDIVDDKGNPTGQTIEREQAHAEGIMHRTSHVWLIRKRGRRTEVLLQKRCDTKDSFPGCYDISSAGHIPAGVDFAPSAIRELKEELGVDASEDELIVCGDRTIIADEEFHGKPFHDRQYTRVFALFCDKDESEFRLQESEVSEVRWMDIDDAINDVLNDAFPNCIVPDELMQVKETVEKKNHFSKNKFKLDRTTIKYIAITAMIIDHIAAFFIHDKAIIVMAYPWIATVYPEALVWPAFYIPMRFIGRLTGPIMAFFLVEGFIHTSSRLKYGLRLLIFGLISQIPYALANGNKLLKPDFNVIITLTLTFLMLLVMEKVENVILKFALVVLIIFASNWCDWGIFGPLMALAFYILKDDRKGKIKGYASVCALLVIRDLYTVIINKMPLTFMVHQLGVFLVILFLLLYNGEPGKKSPVNKWLFYVIYPLHLLVIWFVKYRL